jgi:N-acetylglucosaminyldiphosphoundecaprenol N-acetyl-beta-D-mannosaminyltransferase
VLDIGIHPLSWQQALDTVAQWSHERSSRYVCICNVHVVVTASREQEFGRIVREADMATPDGAPVAWMLRRMGSRNQERVNGPDLMLRYCEQAAARDEPIFLFGSTDETLSQLQIRLKQQFPKLVIAGAISPPFRKLSAEENDAIIEQINSSGAGTVWVSLGCPKQEQWMAANRGRVRAVMLGVGAAFDFHAGTKPRAPEWMRNYGLEWLHRLLSEPQRLWRRYLVTNTLFICMAARQLLVGKS